MATFICPRTCPMHGDRWCRFRAVLDWLGPVRVDSHTARINTEFRDPKALRSAVESIGGTWIGQGSHRLYGSTEYGLGFTLPDWRYPLVARANGELAYDDYNGSWGNVADLDRLRATYTLSGVIERAAALGWQHELTAQGLVVYHPAGGTITIQGQDVSTAGFVGGGCHDARMQLGLTRVTDVVETSEAARTVAAVQIPG